MAIRTENIRYCLKILVMYLFSAILFVSAGATYTPVYASHSLLIIRSEGKDFEQAVVGLGGELEDEFSITDMVIDKKADIIDITKKIKTISPKIVVLMDNRAIHLYKKYQTQLPASKFYTPSVSIMGVFIDTAIENLKNATGIYYEVPVVTSVVNLRSVLDIPFKKVGMVHRPFMNNFVTRNKNYCEKEGVELISHEIPDKGGVESKLKKGLKLLNKKKIDALWVPNDSAMLNNKLLQSVWLPFARKFNKPIIVGVEVLVNPKFNFGTFAVIPDHTELGMMAAEMVFEAMDNNWNVEGSKVEPPRSVQKIINLQQARQLFKVSDENLKKVDKIAK